MVLVTAQAFCGLQSFQNHHDRGSCLGLRVESRGFRIKVLGLRVVWRRCKVQGSRVLLLLGFLWLAS